MGAGTRMWATLVVATGCFLGVATPGAGQERAFHGLYVGAEAAREDLIGGSFVDGVDVLAQADRGVVSLVGGARYQAGWGLVLGAEATWGRTDGALRHVDPGAGLTVTWAGDTQTSIGAQAGYVLPSATPVLLFVYASEVTRSFDVTVDQDGTSFEQSDEQGMLRYGVGVEVGVVRGLRLRARLGSGRADFGDAITSFDPARRPQFGLGVLYQF